MPQTELKTVFEIWPAISPLASLMDILGALIERYEDEHVPELDDMLISNN